MKLVLFGSTGGTGRNVVARGLAAGHEIVAVARRPEAIETRHERLRTERGDVLDAASVASAVKGADALIATFGPTNNRQPGKLLSDGMQNIVDACTNAGVGRVVFESGLMQSDGSELSFFGGIAVSMARGWLRALYEDKIIAESTLRASTLDWVIVRPPVLNHAPATGSYKVGSAIRVNPTKSLSHDDVADFLVQAAADSRWTKQVVNIGY